MPPYVKEQWRAQVENGQIPRHLLAEVVPKMYDPDLEGPAIAHPEAAAAISAMFEACPYKAIAVKYSYRTLAKQWEKWNNYQAGGNLAAYPGTSNHGWAVAFDLNWSDPRAINWFHANCRRFGFLFDVTGENWHITYQGGYVEEEDEMTPEQIEKLKDAASFKSGLLAFVEAALQAEKDGKKIPDAPKNRDKGFYEGWKVGRFAFRNPKE